MCKEGVNIQYIHATTQSVQYTWSKVGMKNELAELEFELVIEYG